ncbi:pre-peptidase C-terminal domain-containing protein [Curvibacter sp. APW13]|uniref:pre-peptidase C-terminal domain-containing protein n=1 Tax=Curvibacter sp. APW13 TaxID=3077236 RepID=UPI0028DF522B|nr:pre-peptidase C-terminal domain-containing protein [Curvibacter sp. APW13]MDT8992563.1 pre-peptidase C-terminal domain-containing protein [Curvibacter sp. APW13]
MKRSNVVGVLLMGALLSAAPWVGAQTCRTTETESNNTADTANGSVCSGTAISASLSSTSDLDWYKFDVTGPGTITISVSHGSSNDFDWYLYPSLTGSYVAYKSTTSNPEVGSYSAPSAGTYYLRVKSYTGSGSYTVNVTYPNGSTGGGGSGFAPVTGKVWLNGGGMDQTNTAVFVNGLRNATGRNTGVTPNINSTANCSTDWATTPCPRIAVITASANSSLQGVDKFNNDLVNATTGAVSWSYYNLFQRHGFSPKHVLSHHDTYASNSYDTSTQGQANIAIVNQADVVYIIGGDQFRVARTLLKDDGSDTPLMAAIRARQKAGALIYAGDSAGTAIAPATSYGEGISLGYLNQNTLASINIADCPYRAPVGGESINPPSTPQPSCTTLPSNPDYGAKIKGLGFIPNANVETHFDTRKSATGRLGRMINALKNIGPDVAYGINENTALFFNGDVATVYGANGVYVAEKTANTFPTGSKLTASGIVLSYLTAGDTFRFSDRSITTTKSLLIGSTGVGYQYSSYLDSNDIFAVDANGLGNTTKVFTHLGDQSPIDSIGNAPSDKYNPSSFKLTFKRDATTKAYKNATGSYSGPYTIMKARLDVQ